MSGMSDQYYGSNALSQSVDTTTSSELTFTGYLGFTYPIQRSIAGEQLAAHDEFQMLDASYVKPIGYVPQERYDYFDYDLNQFEDSNKIKMYPELLNLQNLNLTHLNSIENYKHIRYIDLSGNKLTNASIECISALNQLVTLILDNNKLVTSAMPALPSLLYLSLNENLIAKIESNGLEKIKFLFLNRNKITVVEGANQFKNLTILSLSKCRITKIDLTFYSCRLEQLYLSYNRITEINGIDELTTLKKLHLRSNKIKWIKGFSNSLKKLYYLNLRDNKIARIQFQNLTELPRLRIIILSGNPVDGLTNLREVLLMQFPKLRRINKFLVTQNELNKVLELKRALELEQALRDKENLDEALEEQTQQEQFLEEEAESDVDSP